MDPKPYKRLVSNLNVPLCDVDGNLSIYVINKILECKACMDECLSAAVNSIDSRSYDDLLSCLEDAGCLLQMLSNFIRKVLESSPFAFSSMKQYPTVTGSIILSVFEHCKNSELVYGEYLNGTQSQLRDLFRMCHELQLIYLMTLEKHFAFDFSQAEDLLVLLEALHLNLKIGQVVQHLDVKTMAEQWKAYTALCDKYCDYLEDKEIFRNCIIALCEMIRSNLRVVLEMNPDGGPKAAVRSLKVARFGIIILTKVCNIFKKATHDTDEIIDLLIFLNMLHRSCMDMLFERSLRVTNLIEDNVKGASEALLAALVANDTFIPHVCKVKEQQIENDKFVGYTILLTSSMRISLDRGDAPHEMNLNAITRIFHLLPKGHTWFNVGIEVAAGNETFGLFEFALAVSSAFARTFGAEQYAALERLLFARLLGSDCYAAVFAADLWSLLARSSDPRLVAETALSLLEAYRGLAGKGAFQRSPQRIYLTHTIRNMLRLCTERDKSRILNAYKMEDFFEVWSGLRLTEVGGQNVSVFAAVLKRCLSTEDIGKALAPTERTDEMSEAMLALWSGWRPGECDRECERLERLTALTEAFVQSSPKPNQTGLRIHKVMGETLKRANGSIAFVLLPKYCSFLERGVVPRSSLDRDVFVELSKKSDELRRLVVLTLRRFAPLGQAIRDHPTLTRFLEEDDYQLRLRALQFKSKLNGVENDVFSHKCPRDDASSGPEGRGASAPPSAAPLEPRPKRAKLSDGEVGELVSRLEEDASRLCGLKDALGEEHKWKLSNALSKLQNIL